VTVADLRDKSAGRYVEPVVNGTLVASLPPVWLAMSRDPGNSRRRGGMRQGLRERCRHFLEGTPPPRLDHARDAIAARILRKYSAGAPPEIEAAEMLEIVIADSRKAAGALGGTAAEYLLARAALLEEIASEG
jgi:hypothetical protein